MRKIFIVLLLCAVVLPLYGRRLYITRHGQVGYAEHHDHEAREPKLTPLGIEQAKLLGEHLKTVQKFNGTILVSPILRTIETGVIIADFFGQKVILETGIQEVNRTHHVYGMSLEEIEKRFPGKYIPGKNFTYPWRVVNENPEIWSKRYIREMDRILQEFPGDLLLVTHGGGVSSMVPELCRRGNLSTRGIGYNCSLFIFELDENDLPVKVTYVIDYIPKEKITSNRSYPFASQK